MRRHHRTVLPAVLANVAQMKQDNIAALAKQAQDALQAVDDHRDALAANVQSGIDAALISRATPPSESAIDAALKPLKPIVEPEPVIQ